MPAMTGAVWSPSSDLNDTSRLMRASGIADMQVSMSPPSRGSKTSIIGCTNSWFSTGASAAPSRRDSAGSAKSWFTGASRTNSCSTDDNWGLTHLNDNVDVDALIYQGTVDAEWHCGTSERLSRSSGMPAARAESETLGEAEGAPGETAARTSKRPNWMLTRVEGVDLKGVRMPRDCVPDDAWEAAVTIQAACRSMASMHILSKQRHSSSVMGR